MLCDSITKKDFNELRPLDVIPFENKYVVLSGNMRLRAYKKLKHKSVICNILSESLSIEELIQIMVQGNTTYGEDDHEVYANEYDSDLLHEWGYDVPDWEEDQVTYEETQGDDDVPESAPAITVKVDLYLLGEHRLLCGDSTMIDDVEKLMDGEKADMVFTDPPYGVSYQSNMRTKSQKFDVLKNDNEFISEWINHLPLINKGFVFIWTTWKVLSEWIELTKPLGAMSNMIIWDKGGGGIGDLKKTFSTDYEIALVWHNENEIKGKRIGSVWDCGKDQASEYLHPTQKPVNLAETAILSVTQNLQIVTDLFLGSGSTLIACEKTNRQCYGMELDEKYCDVIVKRYIEFCIKNNKESKVYRNGELIKNEELKS